MTVPPVAVVHPLGGRVLQGEVRVPGDKSVSHRALILGALSRGRVHVTGAAPSEDVRSTAQALRRMGARVDGDLPDVVVEGPLREPDDVLDCGNSGTAMRLLAGACAGVPGLSVLTGDASLRGRPMDRILAPLRAAGVRVDARAGGRLAPLVVHGGAVRAREHTIPVASAQVKSCLLLAGLRADGATTVREPGPSRDHTERMLRWLGADVRWGGGVAVLTPGSLAPRDLAVPADPSSGAFWAAAAAVLPHARVVLPDQAVNPTRTGLLDVLADMGARVELRERREACGEPVATVVVAAGDVRPVTVRGDLVVRAIDELPILAVAAALGGGAEVADAGELRVKESDRIEGIAGMLRALGAVVETSPDGFRVPGGQRLHGGTVDSGGDHRIAMAAAVAALAASGPVVVTGFAAVATSYPTFLQDLEVLGGVWEAGPA